MSDATERAERRIVATERAVERLGLAGHTAETRGALMRRLTLALAPEVRWAGPELTRLALTESMRAALWEDALLGPLVRAGGASYLRTVDLVDVAIGEIRKAATPVSALERADAQGGGPGLRAAALRQSIVALDRALETRGFIDGRCQARLLADVLARSTPEAVRAAVDARRLVAHGVLTWDASDLVWWRVLGIQLARAGGVVEIEMPELTRAKLDGTRERDPFEALFDALVQVLDEPPLLYQVPAVLGDFRGAPPVAPERLAVVAAPDAEQEARAAVAVIVDALAAGSAVDRVAVAVPRIDEDVLVPLRRAFAESGIPHHDPRGAPPVASAIVATALEAHTLASRGLPRLDVARLLRSRYVDPARVTGIDDGAEAHRALALAADALEQSPQAIAADDAATLEATIVGGSSEAMRPVAKRIATLLASVESAKTRSAHVRIARELWEGLGFPARVGLDARATLARDDVPFGLARAELRALAQDAHGWRVLMDALEAYADAVVALALGASPLTSEEFRHELGRALEAGAPPPGAGRVGAVRVLRLEELGGEPLEHLVLLEANEGVLPAEGGSSPLLTETLRARLQTLAPQAAPIAAHVARDRALAVLASAVATAEHVTVIHRERGRDGEALAPAPFVQGLIRAGAKARRAASGVASAIPLSAREARLRDLAAGARLAPTTPWERDLERRARLEASREAHHGLPIPREPNPLVGDLEVDALCAALLAEEIGPQRPLPVTSLERFARCAFQGYAHQILGARDLASVAETPDARESGNLVHEALAAALTAAAPFLSARPVDASEVRAVAMRAADDVLRRGDESMLRKLSLELTRERVLRVVEWTLAQESWTFAKAEQSFGDARAPDTTWPTLIVAGEAANAPAVTLRGTIDRVDAAYPAGGSAAANAAPAAVRIVDYKSSVATVKSARKELGHTVLQVPLYALAAKAAFGAQRAEGLYLPVAELEPRPATDAGFEKRWEEVMRDDGALLKKRVLEIVDNVRRGALAPTPEDDAACDHCSFDGVCRRPRFIVDEAAELEEAGGGS